MKRTRRTYGTPLSFQGLILGLRSDPNAIWERLVSECLSEERTLKQSTNGGAVAAALPRADESEGSSCRRFDDEPSPFGLDPPGCQV